MQARARTKTRVNRVLNIALAVVLLVARPLALLAWTIHARSDYARLADEAAGPPNAAALRTSLFADLWQVELAHQLAAPTVEALPVG